MAAYLDDFAFNMTQATFAIIEAVLGKRRCKYGRHAWRHSRTLADQKPPVELEVCDKCWTFRRLPL